MQDMPIAEAMRPGRAPVDTGEFKADLASLLAAAPDGLIRDHHLIELGSEQHPWIDTGIDIAAGDKVTTFTAGKTVLTGTPIEIGADFQLWCRIGEDGEAFRGTRASNSFTADRSGRLYIGSYFPGEWATRSGELATPLEAYEAVNGDLAMAVIRWEGEPVEALKQLLAQGDVSGLIAAEIDRLTAPVAAPDGWHYLWFVGPAEIYKDCETEEHKHAICCSASNDCGLLLKDVPLPFVPGTKLRWSWRMEELPSDVSEDEFFTHDYLSIAVEFENGQDLTYFWSRDLPVGTGFRCPIPTWAHRETHVAVRSGTEQLGQWVSDERDVYADYAEHVGGDMPGRIVRVWLIALTLFQQGTGKCQYADISFQTPEGEVTVL
ncbi:DUF3047 domain-containing protein [Methyloligella sp. 2.7D]|uniref:DUF3047 domain-containing protein n=1 Tax=unclassified Methyloligella TaxID=2625955 RepID=UPI00157C0FD4|nr:DUF3047 domain-containing protein [Methyloligella sp. GL2]QKP78575.1 DUF3047 domain-containing protein [Methyloligella sp. GL2]